MSRVDLLLKTPWCPDKLSVFTLSGLAGIYSSECHKSQDSLINSTKCLDDKAQVLLQREEDGYGAEKSVTLLLSLQ